MAEVGSASGLLEAVQQLSSALGGAALGTIVFSAFKHHLPTYVLAIAAWACLLPLGAPSSSSSSCQ
jgi:predicted MFS family arabinose efflux permease